MAVLGIDSNARWHFNWVALSGRGNMRSSGPRALPSASLVEAFGLWVDISRPFGTGETIIRSATHR